ncbi:PREDICTED: NAC domain-containing protein 78-like isoform X1 [Lupinus angustifolius]|uniref:NAC domain-containing protein 78-like isoform X1 n=1 Tax=Lupinus angustifolius TaxID=3871 RepID=UPI00092E4A35|nr:PREDICTED: NAC domain-containing protein 78-like isoform X1 [Lupinus angustifolius]
MSDNSQTSFFPGFRFHPTDEELVRFYLKRKLTGKHFRFDPIAEVDVYKKEPWDLPHMSKLKTRDLEWYFYSALDKKYGNGSRTKRITEKGYWKTTGKDRPIKQGIRVVGMKKTLVYHAGRAPHGDRTNWVMHEYKLVDEQLAQAGILLDGLVLCRIFEKSGAGPKNGEKYGAPLIEEEWEDDEVAPVPSAGDKVSHEVLAIDPFLETNDFEKKVDMVVAIENAGPPSNFYHGECSNYPENSQDPVKDQKPLEGNIGLSEPQNGQLSDTAEQYTVEASSIKDGNSGELGNIENAFDFDFTFDDLDIYFNGADYPLIDDTGSFLETKDLANPCGVNPTEADPSGTVMIDEYLSYSDDDISKYLSFDSPLSAESENSIPDQKPLIQQNAEGVNNGIPMSSKHDFEALSSNEASSKQNPQPLSAGITNPVVKQANKLLASIPAPPAFASEFPPKHIALGLAAQSSSSAHVTAGMISITDITSTGNVMDKNGRVKAMISTEFSQSDIYSVTLIPVLGLLSRKTAFVLSHEWVFFMMMLFPLLILSLVCKFGSFTSAAGK